MDNLVEIAKNLVAPGKGILAADESLPTIEKRFKAENIPNTPENRHAYRELLFTTPGLEKYISGIIQFEETLKEGILKNPEIISGIKVDGGTEDYNGNPNEKITKGLEGLSDRLKEYRKLGAKFTKWRAVFKITPTTPSIQNTQDNAERLAEFARVSQEEGFVPIVEPEVLVEGIHDIDKCYEITRAILKVVFIKLNAQNVNLLAMLLKPNMILPGSESGQIVHRSDIAEKTIEVMDATVPPEVPGIVFLSGGQTPEEATNNLNQMNKIKALKWQLSFSFGRALQEPVLHAWAGDPANKELAQKIFLELCENNSRARYGKL